MSLQVWLPLNGDLHDQGLKGVYVTNNGATIDNNGKIGKCYYFNGSAQYLQLNKKIEIYNNDFTWAMWLKPIDNTRGILISEYASSGASNVALELLGNRNVRIYWNGSPDIGTGVIVPINEWSHLIVKREKSYIKVYLNGVEKFSREYTLSNRTTYSYIRIGDDYRGGTSVSYMGYLNDVRIYDHALSQKEIKELASGLICHYKLNGNYGDGLNLIANGFGELGNQYWDKNGDTSDIPSNHPEIKASFPSIAQNEIRIPIMRNMEYKISVWIKSSGSSTQTYSYPMTLHPYDIDGNFINNYQSKVGFNLDTMTTITQQLNPGDTQVHVASLAKWNANSGTYYDLVAIFGYKDSTGYEYPEGTYTRNTLAFANGTEAKINLNKTNNIITLNSAYTGPIIKVGTKCCAATYGSTYFYSLGAIRRADITDWTYKETIISCEDPRLLAATSAIFVSDIYSNNIKTAGMKIINQTLLDDKIYDCSGYNNNADIIGTIVGIQEGPRYNAATYIQSTEPTVHNSTGEFYISSNLALTNPNQITIAWWANPESGYGNSISHAMWSTTANDISSDYQTSAFNHRDTGFDVNSSDGSHLRLSTASFIKNEWHHYVVTYNGKTAKLYKDGTQQTEVSFSENKSLGSFTKILIGHSRAGGVHRKMLGKYSDFRVYVTALSDAAVKELYNTSASIDNNGNVYAREVVE